MPAIKCFVDCAHIVDGTNYCDLDTVEVEWVEVCSYTSYPICESFERHKPEPFTELERKAVKEMNDEALQEVRNARHKTRDKV